MTKRIILSGYMLLQYNIFIHKKQMDLPVVPLHRHPEYKMQCCKLINDEWKRSETARLRSLECSGDNLPTCLILIENEKVIGHCKLSAVPSIKDACFIESVVIDKKLRGRGYGTYLMQKAEEYCKKYLNLSVIYLSTKGQELFYSKLGYLVCPPVSIYGSYIPKNVSAFNSTIIKSNNTKPVMYTEIGGINKKIYMCKAL